MKELVTKKMTKTYTIGKTLTNLEVKDLPAISKYGCTSPTDPSHYLNLTLTHLIFTHLPLLFFIFVMDYVCKKKNDHRVMFSIYYTL